MYAIIRAGGKQAKVHPGDVIDIERVKGDSEELSFEPLLVVDDDGNAVSDTAKLAKASVKAKVLGETQGSKIDIFKYKNKSGYSRRQGHRQKYTRIEITGINLGPARKPAAKKTAATKTTTETKKPASNKKPASTKKATATKPAAAKPAKSAATEEE